MRQKISLLRSADQDQVRVLERGLRFVGLFLFLNRHVLQFAGLENVPTFLTFHIFGFFIAGDDLHPGMLALFRSDLLLRGLRRLAKRHRLVDCSASETECALFLNLAIFCGGSGRMSSTQRVHFHHRNVSFRRHLGGHDANRPPWHLSLIAPSPTLC